MSAAPKTPVAELTPGKLYTIERVTLSPQRNLMELTFPSITKTSTLVYRGTVKVAYMFRAIGERTWTLRTPEHDVLATGTPAKLRFLAVQRFCTCAACNGGAK